VKYHEPIPALNPRSTHVLEAGHYVAVEPAIYLPGKYGVRNEQNVLVTPAGPEVLSSVVPLIVQTD
jgi:Xaa-Pro aminopeptidase